MRLVETTTSVLLCLFLLVGCQTSDASSPVIATPMVTTTTSDGVTIFGERYFGDLGAEAPLVLLFHQGGSNGRGEYGDLVGWLNDSGYRAIAWDQRRGGDTYGAENRTVLALPEGTDFGYCDAAPDLQAALDYVDANGLADRVVIWGSSYSAALVFQAASDNPDRVAGVIAFSPASGGPLENCRARLSVDAVVAPKFVLRPASEMEITSVQEQRDVLIAAGTKFLVVKDGVHGSSMLDDARTGRDMSAERAIVRAWLDEIWD